MRALELKENEAVALGCSFLKDEDDPDLNIPNVMWDGPSLGTATITNRQTTPNHFESTITFTATRQHHGQFTCSVNDARVGNITALFQMTIYCEYPQSLNARK